MLDSALRSRRSRSRRAHLSVELLEGRLVLSHGASLTASMWTAIGPAPVSGPGNLFGAQTGRIESFAAHPTDLNTVYIAADQGGVWKSTNWLATNPTWTPLTDARPSLRSNVHSLAVSRSNPNVVYAGAAGPGGGVLKSSDGGATWTLLSNSLFDGSEFGAIVVSPSDANTVYVATNCGSTLPQGVFKSTDGGLTWTNTTAAIHAGCVSDLVIDPTNATVFYAGLVRDPGNLSDGVYKTTNAGVSWTRLSSGLPFGAQIGESVALAVAPSFSQTVYATIFDAVTGRPARFRSLNSGTTWTALATLPTAEDMRTSHALLAVDVSDSNTIFVNGDHLVYRSTNGGANWSQVLSGADPVAAYTDLTGAIALVADEGIYRSTNLGGTWTNRQGNLQIAQFFDLALDPANSEAIFGVAQDFSGFVATTGSLAWSKQSGGAELGRIVVNPVNPRQLYGYTPAQPAFLLRSDDAGLNWFPKNSGIDTSEVSSVSEAVDVYRSITIDATNPDHLLLGARRVYETTNRGESWSAISGELSTGQRITALQFAPSSNQTAYAGTTDGKFFRSLDGGRTWTRRDAGLPPGQTWDIEVDPTNANKLYVSQFAASSTSVFFSNDGGGTWSNLSGDLPATDQTRTLAVDWRVPTPVLYVGTGHGVFRSLDGGVAWSRSFAAGMPNTEVNDLEIAPGLNILAAGTFGRGAFELRVLPFTTSSPDLVPADDSGASSADDVTNVTRPRFSGTGWPGAVQVELVEGTTVVGTGAVDAATGAWSAEVASNLTDGVHSIKARVVHPLGHVSPASLPITIVIDTTAPPVPSVPDLQPASDTGVSTSDDLTADATPGFTGTVVAGSAITLFSDVAGQIGSMPAPDGTWNLAVGPLVDGVHRVSATATDVAGNTSGRSAELPVTIDTSPPFFVPSVPDLVASSDTGSSNTDNITMDSTPAFIGDAVPTSAVVVLANGSTLGVVQSDAGGVWSFTLGGAGLADGVYDVSARLMDAAGNMGPFSAPVSVTIDTVAAVPSVPDLVASSDTGISDSDDNTRATTPTLVGTAEPGSSVALVSNLAGQIGIGTADAFGDWTIKTVTLANGTHQISAVSTDRAGNVGIASAPATIVIDTIAPAAPAAPDLAAASDSGVSSNDNVTNIVTPFLAGTAPAGMRLAVVSSGDGLLTTLTVGSSGAWGFTSRALQQGVHSITVTATDPAGNTSPASPPLVVTIDTTPPTPPTRPDLAADTDTGASDTDNVTRVSEPTFLGTAEPGSVVSVLAAGLSVGSISADASGAWSIVTAALADGTHTITSRASDAAGNTSGPSSALTIVVDSVVRAPATPDLDDSSDSGDSTTDNITSAASLRITGTAEPTSTVAILDGAGLLGSTTSDGVGRWSFVTDPLQDGVHSLSVRATDLAGNESAASGVLAVQVDTTRPAPPVAPALVDDTGLAGDDRTNVRRPRLTGVTEPLARAELMNGDEILGSVTANAAGVLTIQLTRDLADGAYSIKVRVTDAAGNSSTSGAADIFVDATQPRALAVSPFGVRTAPVSNIAVTFNDDDLTASATGESRYADSVVNPANFSLVASGGDGVFGNGNDRVVDLATSQFSYSPATDQLDVRLRNAQGDAQRLLNDAYRFTVSGTTSVRDVAGNSLAGGDFVHSFTVAVPAPRVADVTMVDTKRSVTQVVLTFTLPLDDGAAGDAKNFQLFGAGRDKRLGTPDDVPLGVGTPVYDAVAGTVTLRPPGGFATGKFVRLVVRDSLIGATLTPLDGDSDGVPGGNWTREIGRGRSFSFQDGDGDTVNVFLFGAGTMDFVWSAADAGPRVRVVNAIPGVSTLTGGLRRARGGDGLATIQSIVPAGSALIRLSAIFRIAEPPVAALVDEVLLSPRRR